MKKNSGMTLIEILIAITIGIIMTAAVIFLFIQSKQSYKENENIAVMQENARFSLHLLSNELRHAGFFGGILRGDSLKMHSTVGAVDPDCGSGSGNGWLKNYSSDMFYTASYNSASNVISEYPCISDADKVFSESGTLEVRSVLPVAVAADELKADHLYIRTNVTSGCIWKASGADDSPSASSLCPTGSGIEDWELVTNLYYISIEDPDTPKLCREQINQGSATTGMKKECFTDGIERFYIEFGVDSSGNDGVIDSYTTDPEPKQVVSARIYLLVKSLRKNAYYNNDKTYTLGSSLPLLTLGPFNDMYKRRVYSTTVLLRNIVNMRNF